MYCKVNEEGYQQDNLADSIMVAGLFLFLFVTSCFSWKVGLTTVTNPSLLLSNLPFDILSVLLSIFYQSCFISLFLLCWYYCGTSTDFHFHVFLCPSENTTLLTISLSYSKYMNGKKKKNNCKWLLYKLKLLNKLYRKIKSCKYAV